MAHATAAQLKTVAEAVKGLAPDRPEAWLRLNCPVCITAKGSADNRVSLGYQPSSGGFRCFRCGVSGNASKTGPMPKPVSLAGSTRAESIGWANTAFSKLYDTSLWQESEDHQYAYQYMLARGFGLGDLERADVRVCTDGVYDGRIVVPHKDLDGAWWGFTARSFRGTLGDAEPPKVMYPKGMSRDRLYNDTELQRRTWEPLLLVEGCLDALHYFPNVCAFLGKPTTEHLEVLCNTKRPLLVCLDSDAESVAWKLVTDLRSHNRQALVLPMLAGQDPASVDPEWLKAQIAIAAQQFTPTDEQLEFQQDATRYL